MERRLTPPPSPQAALNPLDTLRTRFLGLFRKAEPSSPIDPYKLMPFRPGLTPYEQAQAANQRLSLDLSYFLEQNVSIYSDIALTLRQELFRNGIEWKQKFAAKCVTCGAEHEEFVPKCETCGSEILVKPEPGQKLNFNHADGTTFFTRCNRQGQTLKDVLEEFEFHLEVADRGILLLLKYYGLDDEGNVTATVPLEVMTLDPRFTTLLYDVVSGLPGGKGKICLAHRGELQGQDKDKCGKCGKKLYDAIAKTEYPTHSEYYVDGEVFWTSKYFPKFGRPPVFAIIDDAWGYHYLEKRIRNEFEKGRPPSILEIPSNNIASVTKMMNDVAAMLQQDSDYFPWVATDPASHKGLTRVDLLSNTLSEKLEAKADIRQRFGSFFGVMPLFQGDVGSSGGLNNESRQLEVSNRAFARGQSIYHDKVFPWLMLQFAINDWLLNLPPAEDADELADEQIISLQFDNMKKALDMGMMVDYKGGKVHYSGSPKKQEPIMPPMGLDQGPPDTGAAEGPEPQDEGLEDEENGMSFEELQGMFTKSHTCPGGQHSHDDYDGGKCHDANQVHRGGRTDRVGPEQSKAQGTTPGLMQSPNPTNPVSKPSADIKENEKKVGEILALGEVRKPIGKVKEEMAQCKESYQIETQKGMATFHISDDQRVYVHFQPHGNGKPMDFQVQADSRSLDILRGTEEKPAAPKAPEPKKEEKVERSSNVEKPFAPGTLPESITFEGKKLPVPEKNREAVKRWLNDNHIIHAHFDEKSFTDEDAHTVGVTVAENMAILPQMGAACQFLGNRTDIREQLGAKRTRGEYAYFTMASDQAHGGIAVNENALKNREAMFKEMKESNQKKWSPEGCGTLKSLIDHECGHAIDYATRGSIGFDKLYDEWFNLPREQKINTLSEYALKDRREWFAECWSEYRNNPNPRKYAKAIGELVMNYAKRDKR